MEGGENQRSDVRGQIWELSNDWNALNDLNGLNFFTTEEEKIWLKLRV